jgi:hypothetical protein
MVLPNFICQSIFFAISKQEVKSTKSTYEPKKKLENNCIFPKCRVYRLALFRHKIATVFIFGQFS